MKENFRLIISYGDQSTSSGTYPTYEKVLAAGEEFLNGDWEDVMNNELFPTTALSFEVQKYYTKD